MLFALRLGSQCCNGELQAGERNKKTRGLEKVCFVFSLARSRISVSPLSKKTQALGEPSDGGVGQELLLEKVQKSIVAAWLRFNNSYPNQGCQCKLFTR